MEDIVERLRHWSHGLTYDPAAGLMHEAAAEIERLRNGAADARETVCPHVRGTVTQHCSLNFTLTDEEREAIEQAEYTLRQVGNGPCDEAADTLRKLLERLRGSNG